MSDDTFLTAFLDTSLPRTEWTHAAHVRMAYLMLVRGDGLPAIRDGIRRYNAAHRSAGYHETITVAFVRLVEVALAQTPELDWPAFAETHPALLSPTVLERYYTPETLRSPEAKGGWIEPDREPLPAP